MTKISEVYEANGARLIAWRKAMLSCDFGEAIRISMDNPGCCNMYVALSHSSPLPHISLLPQTHFQFHILAARVGDEVRFPPLPSPLQKHYDYLS